MKLFTSIILAIGLSLNASAALNNEQLNVGISQEFENLNPLVRSMAATTYIFQMVGRSLLTLDPNGKWIPQLAKKIPYIENGLAKVSADKKKLTALWEIRDDAKWGDGTPITCADFAFTHEVALNENVSTPNRDPFTDLEKIEWDPKNPKKCTYHYKKARWDYYQLAFEPLPKHIEEAVYQANKTVKEGYEKNSNYTKNPSNPGLYNGPYLISEVKLSSHVTVIPNPHFYGQKPKIKKITVKLIPNTGTLEANLRSGTIDQISSLGLSFDQALAFEKKVKSEKLPYEVVFRPSVTYEHIDLNLDNPFLKDVRVRKALVSSINREELVKALFEGKQQVAVHNVSPIDSWFTNDPKKISLYPYNKTEAGKLLDSAGWMMGKDGYRYKDGKKLSLTFMTTAGNKTRENVQVFLQNQWKAAGVEIIIRNEPARVFFGETTKKRKFGAMAMFAWISNPENSPKSNLHSKQIPTEANGWAGQNMTGYSNPKVDQLLEDLELEFDAKKRKQMITEILKFYTDEVPVIPLYYRAEVAVRPTTMTHFRLTGTQFSETNEVENWDIKQ